MPGHCFKKNENGLNNFAETDMLCEANASGSAYHGFNVSCPDFSWRLKSLIFKWWPHLCQTREYQVNLKLKSKSKSKLE